MREAKKKIVLFGGSFNPPHAGHVAIVKNLVRRKSVDQVWVLPVFTHRFRKKLFPFADRIKLCRKVFLPNPKVRVRDDERKVRTGGKSCRLIGYLKRKYPHYRFSLAMGSDVYRQRHSWYRFDLIEKEVGLIVFPRGKGSPIPDVASRNIRKEMKKKYLIKTSGRRLSPQSVQ